MRDKTHAKRVGRPRRSPDGRSDERLAMVVTSDEAARVRDAAQRAGRSVSEHIRRLVLGESPAAT